MAHLSILVVAPAEATRLEIATRLQATGHVEVPETLASPARLEAALRAHRAQAVYVDLGADPAATLSQLSALPEPRPVLLLCGPAEDSRLLLQAVRLGAKEFFASTPSLEELRPVVESLTLAPAVAGGSPGRRAPLVGVMGAKGGVGATVLACQLAAALRRLGGRTVLADLNLCLGDVALYYDVEPTYTLADVATRDARIDATYLRSVAERHACGVRLLAAPADAPEADLVQPHHLDLALPLLRAEFDWVLLDLARTWDPVTLHALEQLDLLLLVTGLEVPALEHARRHLALLERLEVAAERIRLVANRHGARNALADRDVAEFLGRDPDVCIPNDYRGVMECVNLGAPTGEAAPRSLLHTAFRTLALRTHEWCGVHCPETERRAGGLGRIGNLFRRGHHGAV